MRYSFAPIDAHRGDIDMRALAARVGVTARTLHRWRLDGLSEENADRCSVALGLIAYELWPEMLDAAVAEVEATCRCGETFVVRRKGHVHCSERCRRQATRKRERAAQRERYRTDPEVRARKIAQTRAYRAEVARALAVSRRVKYRENADELRAKRRARYAANAEQEKQRQARYRARLREEGAA